MCCSGAMASRSTTSGCSGTTREERLTVRRRGGRKWAIGTRAPMMIPLRPKRTLVARLRGRPDDRLSALPDAGDHRRPHPGVPRNGGGHTALPHSKLGWRTPMDFAATVQPRRDQTLRTLNGSASPPPLDPPERANPTARTNSQLDKNRGTVIAAESLKDFSEIDCSKL